jgi:hypothetical protein
MSGREMSASASNKKEQIMSPCAYSNVIIFPVLMELLYGHKEPDVRHVTRDERSCR